VDARLPSTCNGLEEFDFSLGHGLPLVLLFMTGVISILFMSPSNTSIAQGLIAGCMYSVADAVSRA
jgi:hypothetical protein